MAGCCLCQRRPCCDCVRDLLHHVGLFAGKLSDHVGARSLLRAARLAVALVACPVTTPPCVSRLIRKKFKLSTISLGTCQACYFDYSMPNCRASVSNVDADPIRNTVV